MRSGLWFIPICQETATTITAVHSSAEKRMLRSKVGGCVGHVILHVCWASDLACVLGMLSKVGVGG